MYKKVESFIICCSMWLQRTRRSSMAIAKFLFTHPNKGRDGGISKITDRYLRISKKWKAVLCVCAKGFIYIYIHIGSVKALYPL